MKKIALSVCLAGLSVWLVTLTFGFVWDDHPTVAANASLHRVQTLGPAFTHDFWGLHDQPAASGYWRPLSTVCHNLLTLLFGTHPFVFHLFNLLLHTAVSGLLVFLFSRIGLTGLPLWAAGLFFAMHPIHAEAVSFVSAAPDLLAACFGLAALLAAPSSVLSGAVFFSLALLSKESAVIFFPAAVYLSPGKRKKLLVVFGSLTVAYVFFHWRVTGGLGARELWGGAPAAHLGTVLRLAPYGFFLTWFPAGTSPVRAFPVSEGWGDLFAWVSLATVAVFTLWAIRVSRRDPVAAAAFLFYLLFWLPVSNLIPSEGLVADRYLYLPAAATALLAGLVVRNWETSKTAKVVLTALLFVWPVWAVKNALPWKSDRTLWEHAVNVSPASAVAWNEQGGVALAEESPQAALESFDRALRLRPEYREASFNRAVAFYRMAKLEAAFGALQPHLERFPTDAEAWDLAGTVALAEGRGTVAAEYGAQAVALEPRVWKYRYNLALTFFQEGGIESALVQLEAAARLSPEQPVVLRKLAAGYFYTAKWKEARGMYERILSISPGDPEAMDRLAKIHEVMSMMEGARK